MTESEKQQFKQEVTMYVVQKLKIQGEGSVFVRGEGLNYAIGFNAPAIFAGPIVQPGRDTSVVPSAGTSDSIYELTLADPGDVNTLNTDYFDLRETGGGKDSSAVDLFPTYDSVKWNGPRIIFSGTTVGSGKLLLEDDGITTYEVKTGILTVISRQIIVNSLGAVIYIGPEIPASATSDYYFLYGPQIP